MTLPWLFNRYTEFMECEIIVHRSGFVDVWVWVKDSLFHYFCFYSECMNVSVFAIIHLKTITEKCFGYRCIRVWRVIGTCVYYKFIWFCWTFTYELVCVCALLCCKVSGNCEGWNVELRLLLWVSGECVSVCEYMCYG